MNPETWTAVDAYIESQFAPEDAALRAALAAGAAAGLPPIQVTAAQGKLLQVFARTVRARAILELGTLGGYSTIWLARALEPGGRVVTIEAEPKHARVARGNLERAGVAGQVELREGLAGDCLRRLAAEGAGPFDLVFIDADKPRTPEYFELALPLTRPGGLIVVDNVVRKGAIAEADSDDPNVQGMRRFFERAAAEPRVVAAAIQTVGGKSYDGFALLHVLPR
ncbi:MAG TPA: O-methyltransferase [Opitutaceae bacterium]|jgi:predicted O-methyltransferase YrrM|nr:O-methyltransferase [Opitutaceae bacterium]